MRLVWGQRSASLLAAGHDGGVEAIAQAGGQIINFMRTVDFDSFLRGVEDDLAVAAAAEVSLQFGPHLGRYRIVDQVVEKGEKLFAGHFTLLDSLSPLFLWKYRLRRSRSCSRARSRRDLTAGMLSPSVSAVSSVESPSTSLSTNTMRNPCGSP